MEKGSTSTADPHPRLVTPAAPSAPTALGDRFDIVSELGRGGMGTVYEAVDRETGERLAVKTLHRFDAESLYRFKREFRALADLSHPNLVTLYELYSADDGWFFTMERVDGVGLLPWVQSTSRVRTTTCSCSGTSRGSVRCSSCARATRSARGARTRRPTPSRSARAGRAVVARLLTAVKGDRTDPRWAYGGSPRDPLENGTWSL